MKTLYPGMKGADVRRWQIFLRGLFNDSNVIVNGDYDSVTLEATRAFQISKDLDADGIVGPKTISAALLDGFDVVKDSSSGEFGPNWPPRPLNNPLTPLERMRLFGKFSFISSPTQTNPEAIKITDGWAKDNIVVVQVPQLVGVPGSLQDGAAHVHKKVSKQFLKLFDDWQSANLTEKILTWGGSWVPRFVRGSRTSLSNHAWGTAFDINHQWNGLGIRPALRDEKGSVRDLVEIAYQNGFYWGGWFKSRPDGMHFEAYKIIE
jgi:hypothetical protein